MVSQLDHATLPVAPAVGALSRAVAGGARGQGLGIPWPLLGCEEFILGWLAWFALGNMARYSFTSWYLAVTCSVSGCCMWNIGNRILQEISSLGQCLVRQCILFSVSVREASGRILRFFYDEIDSNPVASSPFSRRMPSVLNRCLSFLSSLPCAHLDIFLRTPRGGQL